MGDKASNKTATDPQALAAAMDLLKTRKADQVPEHIYHYCPVEAFFGILTSGVVWASYFSSTNDLSETRHFYSLLANEVRNRTDESNRHILDTLLANAHANLQDYFIASFSKNGDILSQWEMYADQGHGLAIGFYTESFGVKNQIPYMSLGSGTHRGIFPVSYSEQSHLDHAKQLIDLEIIGLFG